MSDLGVILACYERDYIFAKGCCASIRYFLPDVPICLIVDGTFSVKELEDTYGVQVIYRHQVSHDYLRDKKYRSSTKMIAFWESPWPYFLFIDADTVIWGDLLKFANFENYDLVIDQPAYDYSDDDINHWFFNGPLLEKYFPGYHWSGRSYFCTGVFWAKRGIFDLGEYCKILDLRLANPTLFYGMDQGILNLMVFQDWDLGKIRVKQEPMQVIVSNYDLEVLKERFPIIHGKPSVKGDDAAVIHWSGQKPFMSRSSVYPEPSNFFRRQFIKDASNLTGLAADVKLQLEDFNIYKTKLGSWLQKRISK